MSEYVEAAWISRFGSQFPSKIVWLNKELKDVSVVIIDGNNQFNPNINYYTEVMGDPVAFGSGKFMDGEWIHTRLFLYWLIPAIQRNLFSLLKQSGKVPVTVKGAELVKSKLKEVLEAGVQLEGLSDYKIIGYQLNKNESTISIQFKATLTNGIIGAEVEGEVTF